MAHRVPPAARELSRRSSVQPPAPKAISRAKRWSEDVEEAYRFQLAGYRDENEYVFFHHGSTVDGRDKVDRWPSNGFVKKLKLRSGHFYYYNERRECANKDIHRTKLYAY